MLGTMSGLPNSALGEEVAGAALVLAESARRHSSGRARQTKMCPPLGTVQRSRSIRRRTLLIDIIVSISNVEGVDLGDAEEGKSACNAASPFAGALGSRNNRSLVLAIF